MKEEVKEAKPKFEDLLSQEEKAKKDTAKKIKELEKKKKESLKMMTRTRRTLKKRKMPTILMKLKMHTKMLRWI